MLPGGEVAPAPGPEAHLPLVVIVGPTAVGKTALSVRVAQACNGEIVSADSRLFYRGMDIGTAKPTPEQRASVPHHLIDIADPDDTVGLARFLDLAKAAIADIRRRGRVAFLVGGTGQYVRAVVEGWQLPRVPPDPALRRQLQTLAEAEGIDALHGRLARIDPSAASGIDPRNIRRVVRALEVCLATGRPISELRSKQVPPYRVLQVGLTMPRRDLYRRADQRVDEMMQAGLEDEVRRLIRAGYGFQLPALSGLGYAQFRPFFEGTATIEDVVTALKQATRRFIRRQYNWFRLDDQAIRWFDVSMASAAEIEDMVRSWLASAPDS